MGAAAIFNGAYIKTLKDQLRLKDTARILTGTTDPRSVAADAEKGSLYLRQAGSTGEAYVKQDDGSTTNWTLVNTTSAYTPEVIDTFGDMFVDSPFQLLTRSIADTDRSTLVSAYAGTAALDIPNLAYSFAAVNDRLTTIQLLDASEFLNQSKDLWSVDVAAIWKPGFIDTAATYEVSRDGGGHYYTLPMERVGSTNAFRTDYRWETEEKDPVAVTSNTNTGLQGSFDASSNQSRATAFTVPSDTDAILLTAKLFRLGVPAGNYRYAIYSDSAGVPGAQIFTTEWQSIAALSTSATDVALTIDYSFLAGTTYHLVIETDATYKADFSSGVREFRMTLTVTAGGQVASTRYNGSAWSTVAGVYFYFIVSSGTESFANFASFDTGAASTTLNATTNQKVSQAFTLSATQVMKRVRLRMNRAASAVGLLYAQIVRDSAGNPSTAASDVIAQSTPVTISGVGTGNVDVTLSIYAVLPAGTYHLVLSTDAAYKAGTMDLSWRSDAAGGTPGRVFNGTTYSSAAQQFRYFLDGRTLDLRLRITASAASKLLAFGAFYDLESGETVGAVQKRQVFYFNSVTNNTSSFNITAFTPDPNLLSCYYIEAGQVFKAPAFDVQGQTIVFPVNTFNNGGISANVTLVFDQNTGGSFDNSDLNGLLLAANHLGSSDASIDRSSPGRGWMVRTPNGKLVELVVNNDFNIEVYEVT